MRYRDRILRAAAIALLLYSLGRLAGEYRLLCRTETLAEELRERHELLLAQRQELTLQLEQPPDEQTMRRLAWERLGMVAPGERIFYFGGAEEESGRSAAEDPPVREETDREDSVWDWKLEALWKDG